MYTYIYIYIYYRYNVLLQQDVTWVTKNAGQSGFTSAPRQAV